jgi:hypothetical protein
MKSPIGSRHLPSQAALMRSGSTAKFNCYCRHTRYLVKGHSQRNLKTFPWLFGLNHRFLAWRRGVLHWDGSRKHQCFWHVKQNTEWQINCKARMSWINSTINQQPPPAFSLSILTDFKIPPLDRLTYGQVQQSREWARWYTRVHI